MIKMYTKRIGGKGLRKMLSYYVGFWCVFFSSPPLPLNLIPFLQKVENGKGDEDETAGGV